MRNLLFIIIACTILISLLTTDVYAQKQGRIEKLYEHIAKIEQEKYDKARVKIDSKSAETYKNELALGDAIYKLLYAPVFDAIEPYLKSSQQVAQKDGGVCARAICTKIDFKLEKFVQKSDSAIYNLLVDSKEQLKDSRAILAMLTRYNYKILRSIQDSIIVIKERVQLEDLQAQSTLEKCETYLADFNRQFNYRVVAKIYNELLYKNVRAQQNETCILAYFDNPTLKTYYTDTSETRAYLVEVQKIYDTYLFREIQKAKTPKTLKAKIEAYQKTTYLAGTARDYTREVEYKNDSIDYVALVQEVDATSKLPLVKKYVQEHKHKEFLDKAHALRKQFVANTIWSNSTTTRFYTGKNISKESTILNDTVTTTTYNYNEHGFLLDVIRKIEVKNVPPVIILTDFKYNEAGKCYEEESIDTLSKTILHQTTYQYNAKGNISIKNSKWHNDKSRIESYNAQGEIAQIQEYENGQINTQTDFTYDTNGRLTKKIWINMKPNINNPVTKQTTDYTYNEYGFLVNTSYVKETLQNEKISGNLKINYDEFANEIDTNYKYEYDQTGTWISRINKQTPTDMERIEYTYK